MPGRSTAPTRRNGTEPAGLLFTHELDGRLEAGTSEVIRIPLRHKRRGAPERATHGSGTQLRPVLASMFLISVFGYAAIGGALSILLPTQVRLVAGDDAPSALALVTGVSAIASLAVPPVVGLLSDRTRNRWGRRTPRILFGGIATTRRGLRARRGGLRVLGPGGAARITGRAPTAEHDRRPEAHVRQLADDQPGVRHGGHHRRRSTGRPLRATPQLRLRLRLVAAAVRCAVRPAGVADVAGVPGLRRAQRVRAGSLPRVDLALATLVLPKAGDAGRDLRVFHIALTPQVVAPFVASLAVTALDGYPALFRLGGAIALIGSFAVVRVRPEAVSEHHPRLETA